MTMDATRDDWQVVQPPLRFAFFGESIVSAFENPTAITARAVMRALGQAGHEAVFLEERRNRAMVEQLRRSGSGFVRAFAKDYPDLRYHGYDLPAGLERFIWLWQTLATVDAVVALPGTPAAVLEEIDRVETPRLVRFALATDEPDRPALRNAIRLAPATPGGDDNAPAITAHLIRETRRARPPRRERPAPR